MTKRKKDSARMWLLKDLFTSQIEAWMASAEVLVHPEEIKRTLKAMSELAHANK